MLPHKSNLNLMTLGKIRKYIHGLLFSLFLFFLHFNIFSQEKILELDIPNNTHPFKEAKNSANLVNFVFQDHLGLIWLGTTSNLLKYDGYKIEEYFSQYTDSITSNIIPHQLNIVKILENNSGDLWLLSKPLDPFLPKLYRFDRETEMFSPYLHDIENQNPQITTQINSILSDSKNNLWVGTNQGLFKLTEKSNYKNIELLSEFAQQIITSSFEDNRGNLWVSTFKGLYKKNKFKNTFVFFPSPVIDPNKKFFSSIIETPNGKLCLASPSGLYLFDIDKEQFIPLNISNNYTEINNAHIETLYCDSKGQIWAYQNIQHGNLFQLDIVEKKLTKISFRFPKSIFGEGPPSSGQVTSLYEDKFGSLWISALPGIYKHNPQKSIFQRISIGDIGTGIYAMDGIDPNKEIWVATSLNGLVKWNRKTGVKYIFEEAIGPNIFIDQPLISVLQGKDGKIWFGSTIGLGNYDPIANKIDSICYSSEFSPDCTGEPWIHSLFEDKSGDIWIGTFNSLDKLDKKTGKFHHYPIYPKPGFAIRNIIPGIDTNKLFVGTILGHVYEFDKISGRFNSIDFGDGGALYMDYQENLWFARQEMGLYKINIRTNEKKFFGTKDGLPNHTVSGIMQDKNGDFWLSSLYGLSKYSPKDNSFENFYMEDGIGGHHFAGYGHIILKDKNENLYIGAVNGTITYFHPDEIKKDTFPPEIVLTDIQLFDKTLKVGTDSILGQHISVTNEITLKYNENDIAIHYAALHYKNPQKNRYKVKLENYDRNWREMNTRRMANYTNLSPGDYTFKVKACNSDGIWNEKGISLKIKILPPLWKTWWAYLIYVLFSGYIIYSIARFYLNRRISQMEAKRLRELDAVKSRFYTNITHEFRTPLTVIIGMIDQISNQDKIKKTVKKQSRHLLNLINQILDLSKLESHEVHLHNQQSDIITYLKYVTQSFQSLAYQKNVSLAFFSAEEEITMDFDQERIRQIVSNLILNAIKFTPQYGQVQLSVNREGKKLHILVMDSGIGIENKDLPYIFDRFKQVDDSDTRKVEGTGIGLAIVKELIDLMKGSVSVKSELGKGTTFRIILPIQNKAKLKELNLDPIEKPQFKLTTQSKLIVPNINNESKLLIIEDNLDVITYLETILESKYNIKKASNGKIGIELAIEEVPDIIICDVMMPEIDGYEVTQILKGDHRTSHIPIILLTAKGDQNSLRKGLVAGADAYLMKPFDQEELFIRLEKLIESREKLKIKYQNIPIGALSSKAHKQENDLEVEFLTKLEEIIKENLANEDFKVDPHLCRSLMMSRAQLYRKLKAILNTSPADYIRSYRMRYAQSLLIQSNLKISDIASEVGFKDSSHFSKVYASYFSETPMETKKKR